MTSNHGAANSGQRLRVPLSEAFAMQQNSNQTEVIKKRNYVIQQILLSKLSKF